MNNENQTAQAGARFLIVAEAAGWATSTLARALVFCALALQILCGSGKAAEPPAVDHEAVALVHDLLLQRPASELSLQGIFKIRNSDGRRTEVPVSYAIRLDEGQWHSVYRTAPTATQGPEQLVVTHQNDHPTRYLYTQISRDSARTNSLSLSGEEAAVSFAGSDFWLTDLGMEFLHWPDQRLIRDAKITMRLGRPCKVVESKNPRPAEGAYSRVVSWIDSELGNLIYAEAYDLQNKRYKVFSLKGFKKVNGRWQVKDMELRNDRADTRTNLEFKFESP